MSLQGEQNGLWLSDLNHVLRCTNSFLCIHVQADYGVVTGDVK